MVGLCCLKWSSFLTLSDFQIQQVPWIQNATLFVPEIRPIRTADGSLGRRRNVNRCQSTLIEYEVQLLLSQTVPAFCASSISCLLRARCPLAAYVKWL